MRPVLLVHVEDVDAQPVPFLEGSRAEVAGELPVALIHAPRVFQVLVAVVFVGEDFAAALALVAVHRLCRAEKKRGEGAAWLDLAPTGSALGPAGVLGRVTIVT